MKKLLTLVLAFALAVCCLGLVACKDNDSGVVGTYEMYSVTFGNTTIVAGTPEAEEMGMPEASFQLKADGTVVTTQGSDSQSGTYTYADGVVSITIDGITVSLTVDGDQLIMTQGEGDYASTTVYKKA